MNCCGYHRPAKKTSGKNNTPAIAFAAVALRATAAIHRPMANSAATASRKARANPAGFLGAATPKAAAPPTTRMISAHTASTKLMTTCAASTQLGGSGVVERRRRMPNSR